MADVAATVQSANCNRDSSNSGDRNRVAARFDFLPKPHDVGIGCPLGNQPLHAIERDNRFKRYEFGFAEFAVSDVEALAREVP